MSEFGKGFSYCIGLFLVHAERYDAACILWFNVAADHLYELEIPKNFKLKKECVEWQRKCLTWKFRNCQEEDKQWAIEQAKKFLLEWDRKNGISVEEAEWS